MEKSDFVEILQCALLNFDGVTEEELASKYKLNPKLAKVGVSLCHYLKSKESKKEGREYISNEQK